MYVEERGFQNNEIQTLLNRCGLSEYEKTLRESDKRAITFSYLNLNCLDFLFVSNENMSVKRKKNSTLLLSSLNNFQLQDLFSLDLCSCCSSLLVVFVFLSKCLDGHFSVYLRYYNPPSLIGRPRSVFILS